MASTGRGVVRNALLISWTLFAAFGLGESSDAASPGTSASSAAPTVVEGTDTGLEARLRRWVVENGVRPDKIVIKHNDTDDSTLMVLAQDVAAGEVVLSIPAALLFPTRVSASSPIPSLIQNATIGRVSALCLYLVAERALGQDSFWAAWIDTLPTHFYHALSYSDEEMELFQESAFRELRSRKAKSVRKEYDENVLPLLEQLAAVPQAEAAAQQAGEGVGGSLTREHFSYDAFEWAYSIVTTRSVFPGLLPERERRGDVPLIILGPVVDMISHGAASVAVGFNAETGDCEFVAIDALKRGSIVSVGIGMTSNLELLANRGVIHPYNGNNFVLLKFQLDMAADMHASARQAMLSQLNLTNPMTYIVRAGEMPQGLLTSLRVQSLTPIEFAAFHKALTQPVSLENEWRAYRLLISSCNAILNLYRTSLEEDDELLQSRGLSRRARGAVTLRRQEKLIYESIKAWVNEAWSALLYTGATTAAAR